MGFVSFFSSLSLSLCNSMLITDDSTNVGYHYQHSGDHGAIGLALLASGQHECLQHTRSHSRHVTPAASQRSSPLASQAQASSSSPLNHSSHHHQSQSSPTYNSQLPSYQSASMHPPTYTLQPQQVTPSSSSQGQQQQQQNEPASAVPMQMQYMMQMQGQR